MRYVRLKKTIPLKIIGVTDFTVEPRFFDLEFTLYTTSTDNSMTGVIQQNQAYQKILYLVEECINGGILYEFSHKKLLEKFFADYENPFVTLPSVNEITFLEALHSKFNIIAGEHSFVDSIELKDKDGSGQSWIFAIDDEATDHYMLPEQKDFAGELAYFDTPWWTRYDSTVFDNYADDEAGLKDWFENVKTEEFDRATILVLDEIDEAIKNAFTKQEPTEVIDLEEFKAELNRRKKWKPTLV